MPELSKLPNNHSTPTVLTLNVKYPLFCCKYGGSKCCQKPGDLMGLDKDPHEKATGRCLVLHKYKRFAVCGTKFKLTALSCS